MRTTIAIDDDVFTFARQKALREHTSLGHVVSELMRQGIRQGQMSVVSRPPIRSKYAVLPARDEIISSEHVYKLLDQEGI